MRIAGMKVATHLRVAGAEACGEKLIMAHIVTVYENALEKTLWALKQMLGDEGVNELFQYILDAVVDALKTKRKKV